LLPLSRQTDSSSAHESNSNALAPSALPSSATFPGSPGLRQSEEVSNNRTRPAWLDTGRIYLLTEEIKELLSDDTARAVPVAFLDLKKAFDRTWHAVLLKRLTGQTSHKTNHNLISL
jgi:hypothetical protein